MSVATANSRPVICSPILLRLWSVSDGWISAERWWITDRGNEVLRNKLVPVPQTNKRFCKSSRRENTSGWQ
jgi:hypothetical protein